MMEPLDKAWRRTLEDGVLRLPQCDHCQAWNWYPVPLCKHCHHSDFTWQQVPTTGTVYSATRMHRNFTGLDIGETPYIVGLIEPEGMEGIRLTCRYMAEDDRVPPVGSAAVIVICQGAQGLYLGFS